jgi:hypothetical protein
MKSIPEVKGGQFMTILYGIAILTILFVVYQLLAKIGLIKTAAKKKSIAAKTEAEANLRASEYFNPMLLKNDKDYISLGSIGKAYAGILYKSMRRPGTDEEAIFSTFGRLQSKKNISELALYYQAIGKRDLITDILNELTDKEQATLWSIIDKLPNK